jgi:hypothetical protein
MEQVIRDEKGQIIGFNIDSDCQFVQEMQNPNNVINVNSNSMNKAYYNLILSIRDVKMYLGGIKPNRHWSITRVKEYFGFKMKDNNLFLEYLTGIEDILQGQNGEK